VNGDTRHVLRCPVAREALAEKLPRPGRFDPAIVELRGDCKVERELRDDGRFRDRGIADDVECFSDILNAEFHGVIRCCCFDEPCSGGGSLSTPDIGKAYGYRWRGNRR